jgi:hypothetical protein
MTDSNKKRKPSQRDPKYIGLAARVAAELDVSSGHVTQTMRFPSRSKSVMEAVERHKKIMEREYAKKHAAKRTSTPDS